MCVSECGVSVCVCVCVCVHMSVHVHPCMCVFCMLSIFHISFILGEDVRSSTYTLKCNFKKFK